MKPICALGQGHCDEKEVEEIGQRHGSDGIGYYPPNRWGTDKGTTPNVPKHESGYWDEIYHKGYIAGLKNNPAIKNTSDESYKPGQPRKIKSNMPSTCRVCKKAVAMGAPIIVDPRKEPGKKVAHVACAEAELTLDGEPLQDATALGEGTGDEARAASAALQKSGMYHGSDMPEDY